MQGGERSPQHPTHLPFLTETAARGSPGQAVRMLLGGLEEGVLLSPGERWWPWTSAWWGNPGQVREDAHGRVEYVRCQLLAHHLRSSPPEFGEIGCTLPVHLIRTLRLREAGRCPVLSTPGLSAQPERNEPPGKKPVLRPRLPQSD